MENTRSGFAFCREPFRRPLGGEGYIFDVPKKAVPGLQESIHKLEVEKEYLIANQKRTAPNVILGRWCQAGQTPTEGSPVTYHGGRDPVTREPTDYIVHPPGVDRPQGPNEVPIYVTVNIDIDHWPPRHTIREVFLDLEKAEASIAALRADAQKLSQSPDQRNYEGEDLRQLYMPYGYRP